jgi:hypothetical protein
VHLGIDSGGWVRDHQRLTAAKGGLEGWVVRLDADPRQP